SSSLDASQSAAVQLLRSASRLVLAGHMRPDGDCLGGQAALSRVLQQLGKEGWVFNPDPPEPRYQELFPECRFRAWSGGELPAHEVAVMLDFCDRQRLGALEKPLVGAPSKKLIIDHHVQHGSPWWDAAFVDVGAAATGLLVRRIARELGVALD